MALVEAVAVVVSTLDRRDATALPNAPQARSGTRSDKLPGTTSERNSRRKLRAISQICTLSVRYISSASSALILEIARLMLLT